MTWAKYLSNDMADHRVNLYLIALIPHIELREQIKALKTELKERFHAKHALKSPAHITLQMPFKTSNKDEPYLIKTLQEFAANQDAFQVELSGFGCFSPRVIFVKAIEHDPIISLHAKLKKVLIEGMAFEEHIISQDIHPHMTIATRDLSVGNFKAAWGGFKKREFEASYLNKSLFLLKHNGKFWDIYREFLFKNQANNF